MKIAIYVLTCLLFVLTTLYPAGALTAACFGYSLEIVSVSAFAVTIAMLSLCVVILDMIFKNKFENKVIQALLAIMSPLSLINAAFCVFECPQIWVIASALFSACCSCFLTVRQRKLLALKSVALVLSALIVLPIGFFSFIALIFGNIGQNTVIQTVESPNGKYFAQVIDSDQGALGGDTIVDVYTKNRINFILFIIEKIPQRVYFGNWGDWENMQIYWKDNDCLVINSVEYQIK